MGILNSIALTLYIPFAGPVIDLKAFSQSSSCGIL